MEKQRYYPFGDGLWVDLEKLTLRGFVSLAVLIISRGMLTVWKEHGVKALVTELPK